MFETGTEMQLEENIESGQEKFNAIEKVLAILSYFAKNNKPIGTSELASSLNFNKATTSRILTTLRRESYLNQDPMTKQYQLGPMISALSKAITKNLNDQSSIIAHTFCDRLRDELSETVHFETLSGDHFFLAYASRCRNSVSVSIATGDRVYPQIHAGAKCIAAYTHPRLVSHWFKVAPSATYAHVRFNRIDLKKEYNEIIRNGYAIDDGHHDKNLFSIAAPVFDNNGRAIASVVVVAPYIRKHRLQNQTTIHQIKSAAKHISEKLLCPHSYEDICHMYQNDPESLQA